MNLIAVPRYAPWMLLACGHYRSENSWASAWIAYRAEHGTYPLRKITCWYCRSAEEVITASG